ncbi:G-patch domain containing protein [Gracilaria domingensis]|nr:G-patch domain containing protein [Gracilaria domingensis]
MNEKTTAGTISLCEASVSDCPAVLKHLASSRNIRKRRRPSHTAVTARTVRWNKRREKSLRRNPIPATLSEEESDSQPVIPTLDRTKENLAALKCLPRPSEVVHEVEAGSAPEAGLPQHLKQAHYRRVKATTLQMQYLSSHGKPQPVPTWSRINRGLVAYSPYLQPPAGDRELKLLRTPKQLLSRYYRGTLLKVYRTGDHRPTQSSKRKQARNASSSQKDSMVDFLYWATTSDDDIVTASDPPNLLPDSSTTPQDEERAHSQPSKTRVFDEENNLPMPLPATAAEIEARRSEAEAMLSKVGDRFQKSAYIQQVVNMAQSDDDSLPSETDTSSVAPSPPPSESENNAEQNPKPQEKEDLEKIRDKELLRLLQGDLDDEIGDNAVKENGVCNPSNDEMRKDGENSTQAVQVAPEPEKTPCPFEKEREMAMKFCQAINKRPRAQAFLDATTLQRNGKRPKTRTLTKSQAPEPYAMKVMKKMGFKGRLGAREDGCSAPLEATVKASRSGLGAKPKQALSYARHLLSEYEQKQSRSRGRSQEILKPVNIDPGPIEEEGVHDMTANTVDGQSAVMSTSPHGEFSSSRDIPRVREGGSPHAELSNDTKDPDDEWETDAEDKLVDNLRRAVIVEMDAVVKGGCERKKNAFKGMISMSEEFCDKKVDLDDLYERVGHDLTDEDIVKNLLNHFHISTSKEKLDTLMERLDASYESLGPCELLENFRQCRIEENVSCGLLHRGTQRRMDREVKELGLQESGFLFCTFKSREAWPYIQTWKDVFCRLGVSPRQGSILPLQNAKIISANVAAAVLGARVETSALTTSQGGDFSPEELKCVVQQLQSIELAPLRRRRRVLFLSEADNMWHGGSVQFEQGNRALVCSYGSGCLVWIDNNSIIGLSRANFKKLKCIEFGGLLEPDVLECL